MKKTFLLMSIFSATASLCLQENERDSAPSTPRIASAAIIPRSASEMLTQNDRQRVIEEGRLFAEAARSHINDIVLSQTMDDALKVELFQVLAGELYARSEGVQAIDGQLYNRLHRLARRALIRANRVENLRDEQARLAPARRRLFQDDEGVE